MNTTVYFVRHGTTDNNVGGRFQGKSDIPLGETGLRQADCLGERFASVALDAVYTSPLMRARQTADGICARLSLAPITWDGLREIDGGVLEGRTNHENTRDYPAVMHAFRNDPARFWPPEGENARQVHERVTQAVHQIIKERAGKTIAVVSHGFALLSYLGCLDTPFDALKPQIVANASVSCVRYNENGGHEIVLYNDQSHLPEEIQFHSPFWNEPETRPMK